MTPFPLAKARIVLAVACLGAALQVQAGVQSAADVAQVSLVVGQAQLIRGGAAPVPIERGTALRESDRLVTGDDGIVMLVFVDQGRVALRPGSELLIRKYRYDAAGADSDLQLELVRGTVRQISGKAARAQPERYRLSTPVAAIGVRGTDFLARTDAAAVRTYVHEGAITVQARGSGQEPVLHRAGEGSYLLAQGEGHLERHPLRKAELEQSFGIELAPARGATAVAQQGAPASRASARDEPAAVAVTVASAATPLLAARTSAPAEAWPGPHAVTQPVLPPAGAPDAPPPAVAPSPAPEPLPTSLAWGRFYSNPDALPLTLPQPFASASKDRHVTVGEPGAYALWRDGPSGAKLLPGLSGSASFHLAAGEGYHTAASGAVQSAVLSDARLQVNFDQARFQTSLRAQAAGQPAALLNVGGQVSAEGLLLGRAPDQRVAGALSQDGTQAGYLFQAGVQGGSYQGITLWNKQ
ncbi:FecR domain-containing protein [Melaminivora sp.]|uniref:FecR family protein n=1 Tax=Melaminivora sp. TaxID=1933032 RepID=UPI0028AD5758|nr:FecR domain-containing protein [Melaminivora sp.]